MAKSRGFTLLEAIMAMVLIGGLGMTLFGWINSSLSALGRVQEANARSEAVANVLEYMRTVNPMARPAGQAEFGSYRIRWESSQSAEAADNVNYTEGVGLYRVALFSTRVAVARGAQADWITLDVKQVGYAKVREVRLPFQ